MVNTLEKKLESLEDILARMKSVLIAYSGGVDSTFLLKVARDALGEKAVAAMAISPIYPSSELEMARKMAKRLRVRLILIHTKELTNENFCQNSLERCYFCKKELFSRLSKIASKYNLSFILDGSNYDDSSDFRPGTKAAEEFGVRSPLQEVLLTKEDIRLLSKKMHLSTWNKPSLACLSSRIPYGEKITEEKLRRIEKAENFLKDLGIKQLRVRDHNNIARVEVMREDMLKLFQGSVADRIITRFKDLGYTYVTLDLEGYRIGSMNEVLNREEQDGKKVD